MRKITPHIARAIARSSRNQYATARHFGVSQSTVSLIRSGRIWPDSAGTPTSKRLRPARRRRA